MKQEHSQGVTLDLYMVLGNNDKTINIIEDREEFKNISRIISKIWGSRDVRENKDSGEYTTHREEVMEMA